MKVQVIVVRVLEIVSPNGPAKETGGTGEGEVSWDLSNIPPCQSVAQGHFMVGVTHKSRLMHDRKIK